VPNENPEWILDFDYAKNPISANGSRGSHHAHAKKVRAVRTVAARRAQHAGIPFLEHARAELTWYVLTSGRRDRVNLALLFKAMVDGLVDAGVTLDDTPDLMDTPMPRIVKVDPMRNRTAWMELRVTRWDGTFDEGPEAA
jgi:crossover junction endodeoxyribonuclease RusA